jgi:hypothetical protein
MKKLIVIALLCVSGAAIAQHNRGHGHWQRGYGGGWNWVAPVIIGGAIGYELSRQQPYVIVQPQAVMQQQPTILTNCSPWTEIQNTDGSITRTRTCTQ